MSPQQWSTADKGRYSELLAEAALANAGYTLLVPSSTEPFDLAITRRGSNELKRVQVKTIYPRERNGIEYYVIQGKRGNGEPYSLDDADYMVGVYGGKVYMTQTRGLSEYWARAEHAAEKWTELPIN